MVYSPKLDYGKANALRQTQTAEAIRLQNLHRAICNLEACLAKKRKALAIQSGSLLVQRMTRVRQPKALQVANKVVTEMERRSIRDLQKNLFKVKRQYLAEFKRYERRRGFTAYSHRHAYTQHVSQGQSIHH